MNTNLFCFPAPSWKHHLTYTGGFFDEWGVPSKAGNASIELISNATWSVGDIRYLQFGRIQ